MIGIDAYVALLPADAARDHLVRLRQAGVGTREVAAAADVARGTVRDILAGRTGKVRVATCQRILAVSAADVRANALVDAGPTLARLEALTMHGFTKAWIAEELGMGGQPARLQLGSRRVRARTAAAVAELAERVGVVDQQPSAITDEGGLKRVEGGLNHGC